MQTSWIDPVFKLGALALGVLLHLRLKRPADHERAAMLSILAKDAAAAVVEKFPGANLPTLAQRAVDSIANLGNPPTSNREVIRRAVLSALTLELARQKSGEAAAASAEMLRRGLNGG